MRFMRLNRNKMDENKIKIIDFIADLFGIKSKRKIEVTIVRVGYQDIVALFSINNISQNLLNESLVQMVEEYSINILNDRK
jgi:hypothetical protein